MGVICSRIVCQPHYLAHIKREIAKVINCVAPTQFGARSIGRVRKRIEPIIRKASANPLE